MPFKYGKNTSSRRAQLEATEEAGTRAGRAPKDPNAPSAGGRRFSTDQILRRAAKIKADKPKTGK